MEGPKVKGSREDRPEEQMNWTEGAGAEGAEP